MHLYRVTGTPKSALRLASGSDEWYASHLPPTPTLVSTYRPGRAAAAGTKIVKMRGLKCFWVGVDVLLVVLFDGPERNEVAVNGYHAPQAPRQAGGRQARGQAAVDHEGLRRLRQRAVFDLERFGPEYHDTVSTGL